MGYLMAFLGHVALQRDLFLTLGGYKKQMKCQAHLIEWGAGLSRVTPFLRLPVGRHVYMALRGRSAYRWRVTSHDARSLNHSEKGTHFERERVNPIQLLMQGGGLGREVVVIASIDSKVKRPGGQS